MKKAFIIVAILFATATTITIVSCKKDKENVKSNNTENSLMNYELSEMDKAMIAFGEKLKSASKDDATMPLLDGLNTLTNYQNFSMCDASHYSTEMIADTLKVSLDVSSGEVSLSDLNDLYESTKQEILEKFAALTGNQKAIYCIKSSVNSTTKNDLNGFSGTINVDVVSQMEESFVNPGSPSSFGDTDYWYDFDHLGKCDIYIGQCVGRDCITELNSKMAYMLDIPLCGEGYRRYLTDIADSTIYAHDLPDPSSPNGYYALPWRSFWDDPYCVSPSEMNYYLDVILDLYSDVVQSSTKSLVGWGIDQTNSYKNENYNKMGCIQYRLANVNCIPVGFDN